MNVFENKPIDEENSDGVVAADESQKPRTDDTAAAASRPLSARPFIRNPQLGIAVLFGVSVLMLVVMTLFIVVIYAIKEGAATNSRLQMIAIVLQDVFVFIAPALVAAIVVTRLPASFLSVIKGPALRPTLMMALVMVCAMPLMEFIIQLNQSIVLPEPLESWFRASESAADSAVKGLINFNSVGSVVVSVLIVGVLTGFSEEIFFRGALQNLLASTRLRTHAAIWIAAFIFSALHMQFYGFIPRMLLGAFFGYLLVWTGSLWVPVIAHALNNTLAIVGQGIAEYRGTSPDGTPLSEYVVTDYLTVLLSAVVTVLGIIILRRICLRGR